MGWKNDFKLINCYLFAYFGKDLEDFVEFIELFSFLFVKKVTD